MGVFGQQAIQGSAVALGQIHHMDVIADAAAIRGGPIIPKHAELVASTNCHLADEGEEVVGDAERVFPDPSGGMGPHRIE